MKCNQITKWQYTEKKRLLTKSVRDSNGTRDIYEDVPFRQTKRRFIFPTHQKGLLFKKRCDGSNVKIVFEKSERLFTKEELAEMDDDQAQARV
jgi:hypothetical protein